MCFICDRGNQEELHELIESRITGDPGWSVSAVEGDLPYSGWAYTIGLLERFDHPELVATGNCCVPCAHNTLNGVGFLIADGAKYVAGDHVWSPNGEAEARFGPVHPDNWLTDRFDLWKSYYRERPSAPARDAIQVITMTRGRWQDDPGNRRWGRERLDRAPHLPRYKGKGRRR